MTILGASDDSVPYRTWFNVVPVLFNWTASLSSAAGPCLPLQTAAPNRQSAFQDHLFCFPSHRLC